MIKKSKIYSVIMLLIVITETSAFAQDNKKTPPSSIKSKPIPAANFKHRDIGSPSIQGTVRVLSNGIDMTAGGVDIWGVKDEFNFAFVERTGDFDIVTRIESLSAADLYTKAGLMAREDLTAGCRHIYFQVFADNNPRNKNNGGYEFQYRPIKDSTMKAIYPKNSQGKPEFPVSYPNTWIRLQRVKNDFTGYYSTDGKDWKVYTSFVLALPAKVYAGLAVTAHNPYHAVSAKFRNIAELMH